jgi:hypothetical protein
MSTRPAATVTAILLAVIVACTCAPASARSRTWSPVGGLSLIDVPRSSGVAIDAVPVRTGLQAVVLVQADRTAGRLRVVTPLGRVLAEGPTDGAVPTSVLTAGWRLFVTGAGPGGARLWTPAFDMARTLASSTPALPCRSARDAVTPLAGPFDVTIPPGARPGRRSVPSPVGALVFGGPAGGARVATTGGVTLGQIGASAVAGGGFEFAGTAFVYGTADGRPELWTPAFVGSSVAMARSKFVACTPPSAEPFDGSATPVLAGGGTTASVGRDGGTLTAGGLTLTIPAGALLEDVEVTMTPLSDLADSPLAGKLIGGARFEPAGLRFLKPARLTMAAPPGPSPADVLGFSGDSDGSDTHLVPRTIESGTVGVDLWHFSIAGAASGGASAAEAMTAYTPSSAERRAAQRVAAAAPACEAERSQTPPVDGPGCAALQAELEDALADWYSEEVRPALTAALGAPSFEVEEAAVRWLNWAATVGQYLGLLSPNPLQAQLTEATAAATAAIGDMANRRLANCTGTVLRDQLRDVQRIVDIAEQGALDLTSVGLPENLYGACAHLAIHVLEFPPVLARNENNTLRGRVVVDVFNGPDRTDLPLTLTIDGDPVTVSADGSFRELIAPTTSPRSVRLEAEATDPVLRLSAVTDISAPVRDRLALLPDSSTTVGPGGTVGLTVFVAGDGMVGATVSLAVSGPGSVTPSVTTDADGLAAATYTAPSGGSSAQPTVTATFGDASAAVGITVEVPVVVTVSPSAAILQTGASTQFTATVTGAGTPGVVWSATGGTIDAAGRYTAGGTPGSFQVTATSVADPSVSASVPVTVEGALLLSGTVTHEFDNGSLTAFVRAAVLADGTVQILETSGGGTATGLGDCGTNSIVTTVTAGRYLPAPNAYSTTLDVLEFRGDETRTIHFIDETGECRTETTSEADIPNVHALRAVRVVENGRVVAIEFSSDILGPPFLGQSGRLEPQ